MPTTIPRPRLRYIDIELRAAGLALLARGHAPAKKRYASVSVASLQMRHMRRIRGVRRVYAFCRGREMSPFYRVSDIIAFFINIFRQLSYVYYEKSASLRRRQMIRYDISMAC